LNPDEVSPVELGVMLSLLPAKHVLITAARLGLEVAELRLGAALFENFVGGRYHRSHVLPEYNEIERLRYPPTGDRGLWIQYGPAGPPPAALRSEAA
jgi:hypothetical protein